jgi:hypothetical protein
VNGLWQLDQISGVVNSMGTEIIDVKVVLFHDMMPCVILAGFAERVFEVLEGRETDLAVVVLRCPFLEVSNGPVVGVDSEIIQVRINQSAACGL